MTPTKGRARHTKGPWQLNVISPGPEHTFDTYCSIVAKPDKDVVRLADIPDADDPEQMANARLISSAPSLLEALHTTVALIETMIHAFDHCGGKSFQVPTVARNAIKLAEGE